MPKEKNKAASVLVDTSFLITLYDYIEHNAETLTYAKVVKMCDEFDSYRIQWNAHAKESTENIKLGKLRRKRVTK